nr:unnamed protein product [Callosobruchus analis]
MPWKKIVKSGHFKRKVKKNLLRITTDKVTFHTEDKNSETSDPKTIPGHQTSNTNDASTSDLKEEHDPIQSSSLDSDEGETGDIKNFDFSQDIKAWALKHNIKHVAIKDLLEILNKNTDVRFPKDPRTFQTTPCETNIWDIAGGQYWHNGLSSSRYEFWPILFNINEFPYKPMIVGMYYGKGKPSNPNEFLSQFVEELMLIMNKGVMITEYKISVHLKCFICDSPARSYVKGVVNFNSQHGCQKCTIVGEYSHVTHSNYYPNKVFAKRTDESFRLKEDEYHHKTDSVILKLPINMIDCFPVAHSLHLIDLGVMKRLLTGWRDGSFKNKTLKCPATVTEGVTKNLLEIKLPKELHRAIRGLDSLSHWKGLEYRNFLLYIGATILKDALRPHVYEHFLGLFCAITICSTDFYAEHLDVAEALLNRLVDCYSSIYGEYFITSNIHNLTHLTDDVKMLGNLTKISAYPFESKLYEIKNMIRNGNNPLAQIANRLSEKQGFDLWENKELPSYPLLTSYTHDTLLRNIIGPDKNTAIYKKIVIVLVEVMQIVLTKQNDIVYFVRYAAPHNQVLRLPESRPHCAGYPTVDVDGNDSNDRYGWDDGFAPGAQIIVIGIVKTMVTCTTCVAVFQNI